MSRFIDEVLKGDKCIVYQVFQRKKALFSAI